MQKAAVEQIGPSLSEAAADQCQPGLPGPVDQAEVGVDNNPLASTLATV